jgi:hypothetical protein
MKYSTVEDVMASFFHPILPTVEGEPDYQTIHATRTFLQANSRAIDTHLGGGTLGHLGLIISDAAYSNIAPPTAGDPTVWETPNAPGRAPATKDGTAAQLSAARHVWEEDVQSYRTCTSVQKELKKQIIGVFEPIYLEILNYNMVGYANISARYMLDHLFETYLTSQQSTWRSTSSTCAEPGIPSSQWKHSSSRFKTVLTIRRQVGVPIGPSQQINVEYAKIFATGNFMSAYRRCNEKLTTEFRSRSPSAQANAGGNF